MMKVESSPRGYRSLVVVPAMQSLADDLEASLAHLLVSVKHSKYVRTTNLIQLRRGMVCQ